MSKKPSFLGRKRGFRFGLGYASVMKNMTYVVFVGLLGLAYIYNSHYAEKNLRKTKVLENKIREAKWEYMSIKSDIMQKSTRSELIKKLDGYEGLENRNLPMKIGVPKS